MFNNFLDLVAFLKQGKRIDKERVIAKKALHFPEYERWFEAGFIDEYIEKDYDLIFLFKLVKDLLTPEQANIAITKIIEKGVNLQLLFNYAKDLMTPEHIDKYIEEGRSIKYLFKHMQDVLTSEQINKALDEWIKQGKDLYWIKQYMTPEQKELLRKAIEQKKGCVNLSINVLVPSEPTMNNSYELYKKDIEPIQVAIIDDEYVIIDGNKRAQAFKDSGYEKIPAKIVAVKKGWRTDFLRDVVKQYYASRKQGIYFPEYERWFEEGYIDKYIEKGYGIPLIFNHISNKK